MDNNNNSKRDHKDSVEERVDILLKNIASGLHSATKIKQDNFLSLKEAAEIIHLHGVNPLLKWIEEGKIEAKDFPHIDPDLSAKVINILSLANFLKSGDEELSRYLQVLGQLDEFSYFDVENEGLELDDIDK